MATELSERDLNRIAKREAKLQADREELKVCGPVAYFLYVSESGCTMRVVWYDSDDVAHSCGLGLLAECN